MSGTLTATLAWELDPPALRPMPKLLVRHPESGDVTFTLSGERVTVGRRADNTIQIDYRTVSSRHAELIAVNGRYVIRDLGSTNHSYLDGTMFLEADLDRPCKMVLGTVECEYFPDEADTGPEPNEVLRKTVGLLRRQNDELIAKVSEQQNQINILGNARFLTPVAGADLAGLRRQIDLLTDDRDLLDRENQILLGEIERLRTIVARCGDGDAIQDSRSFSLSRRPCSASTAVDVSPDGTTVVAAPVAKLVEKSLPPGFQKIRELNRQLRAQVAALARQPHGGDINAEVVCTVDGMAAAMPCNKSHPLNRLIGNLRSLLHEALDRSGTPSHQYLRTITQTAEFLDTLFTPDTLSRAEKLPLPQIVAVDDDADLLSAIVGSLESTMLPTIGCHDARAALDTLQETRCDLILLDVGLPDLNGIDLCPCIRALPKHGCTPIVFLTVLDTNEVRIRGSLKGGNDFIGKPFNVLEVTLKAQTWALKNQLAVA